MEQKDGGPAFPWGEHGQILGGMSLRDAMAMSVRMPDDYSVQWAEVLLGEKAPAPIGIQAAPVSQYIDFWARAEAAYRYRVADAMIAARATKEPA